MAESSSSGSHGLGESSGGEGRDTHGVFIEGSSSSGPHGLGKSSGGGGGAAHGAVIDASSSSGPHGLGGSSDGVGRIAQDGQCWYVSRKEIDENTPSRRDGMNAETESDLRNNYSTFLQHLGILLRCPQETVITTATIYCHRFYLRQSLTRHDWRLVATACMFLAAKELTSDVIITKAHEITCRHDPHIIRGRRPEELFREQDHYVALVLKTLAFDLDIELPYKVLANTVGKFNVNIDSKVLSSMAMHFVNGGLQTSLCLQYKPNQYVGCAIVLAGSLLKVKLLMDGEKDWYHKFGLSTSDVIDFCDQMSTLYDVREEGSPYITAAELRTGRRHPPLFNHYTAAIPANHERAAMRSRIIETVQELRASLLSDENVVPFDKHAEMEERRKAHYGGGRETTPSKRERGSRGGRGRGRGRPPGRGCA